MILAEKQALLRDIIDNPDDDIPRLIYADWLEDNRKYKEADRLRFDLANPSIDWVVNKPFPGINSITHRRGFPETVHCSLHAWTQQGPQLVQNHPITKVRLTDRQPETAYLVSTPQNKTYYWFPSVGPYPSRYTIPNYIHNWFLNNECGRKKNCWDSEDKAWYALILWAKAQNQYQHPMEKIDPNEVMEVPQPY